MFFRVGLYIRRKFRQIRWRRRGVTVWGDGTNITVGTDVHFGGEVAIFGTDAVEIGDHTIIALRVIIHTSTHDKYKFPYSAIRIDKPVKIGKNVWIGTGAIILPGVTIGDNAIVGAGALVTKDVPCNSMAVGVPAVLKRI
ncbi:DapH/DapD/GlmU-related protein [Sulfitobacter sp. W074]|uniref:acyltransferase n=1 Tax=Sulfitobacter sp. W074 TaxID=2867026 RepID=UPI00220EBC53|nr:acyltransferase [Sulfitobacter sp. W074]UWR39642.1 acyltransferase [Sulfitobacter sp. W074]